MQAGSLQQKTVQFKGTLDPQCLAGNVAQLQVVEYLRSQRNITKALNEFRIDDSQVSVSFKGAGYEATAFLDRVTGSYDLTETKMGLAAVLNDLHKGRDTGKALTRTKPVSNLGEANNLGFPSDCAKDSPEVSAADLGNFC